MTKEQAIEILKCFKDNKIQRDKLEIDNRCGGWKIGRIYKSLELNTAIETVLSMLEEKDKIIEQMTYYIMNLDIDEDICKRVNCDTNSGELDCKDCIKQYFKNKVKEL